jgi:hypothetical protein
MSTYMIDGTQIRGIISAAAFLQYPSYILFTDGTNTSVLDTRTGQLIYGGVGGAGGVNGTASLDVFINKFPVNARVLIKNGNYSLAAKQFSKAVNGFMEKLKQESLSQASLQQAFTP